MSDFHVAPSSRRPGSIPLRRTWSLVSNSSSASTSTNSSRVFAVSHPRVASEVPIKHSAWGSFVPLASATSTLRAIAAYDSQYYDDEFEGSHSEMESDAESDGPEYHPQSHFAPPVAQVPLITRTPISSQRPPSPDSAASSIRNGSDSELHPVLARLERSSKFCAQGMTCSTCRKPGRDFPACGRCRQMWCSRECRLRGGKRHVCPGN